MTALLDAIARVFVAAKPRTESPSAAVPSAAICGRDAEPLACALALLLRARGPVVVCAWLSPATRVGAPATAGARRLMASMQARGLSAAGSGRLVVVRLDDDARLAASQVARAAAAAGDAPVVTAICGPRDDAFDDLLAAQDVAIVVAAEAADELVRLAVATLGGRAVAARPLGACSSWAARSGVWATPGARRLLADARVSLP